MNVADLAAGLGTGVGSMPGGRPEDADRTYGADLRAALNLVLELVPDLPYLPELPGRGPGAEIIGRSAALLVDLPVDLQPHGWRLVDHQGRDARRAASYLRSDLDDLAEVLDGYAGPLKVQVAGPWTLAASLWLPRGERALTDPGARRDLVASLAAGVVEHLASLRGAVPGADLVVQLDEPSLPVALAGHLPSASGYGLVRPLDVVEAEQGLAEVIAAVHAAGAGSVVHSCAADVPVGLLHSAGAQAVNLDVARLGSTAWEALAEAVDGGLRLWAGAVPSAPGPVTADEPDGLPADTAVVESLRRPWRAFGLPLDTLGQVVVTPTCGLAGTTPAGARAVLARAAASARALADSASSE